MKRSCGDLESCPRHDRQTVLPQQALEPEHLQADRQTVLPQQALNPEHLQAE